MSEVKLKKLPVLLTDEDAERFIETADLSEYDLSGFRPMRFEFAPEDERREHAPAVGATGRGQGASTAARAALSALHPGSAGTGRAD